MIKESDINFRTLTYEINVGIFICDPNGKFVYANLALADIFSVNHPTEILGRKLVDFIPPESVQQFMNQFRKSMASGSNSTLITNAINRRDGKTAYIEINSMPFIRNGALLGGQGVIRDITELRLAEIEMMRACTHDSLTGIYNRTFFEAEMKRLERGRQFPISIIVVYMGGLENFSESEDHKRENKLIKRAAHQLFFAFRTDDIVARIGEDEFAILLPSVDNDMVDDIVKRVRGHMLGIKIDENDPHLKFYFDAGTAQKGDRLNSVLRQAETIAFLEKKKNQAIE